MARAKRPALLREIRSQTGCSLPEARYALNHFARWYGGPVSIAALRRHPRKVREYVALAQGFVPPGWAVEVTLRTLRGGRLTKAQYERTEIWYEGKRKRRRTHRVIERRMLYLKVVTTARVALPLSEHEDCVVWAIRTGALQDRYRKKGFTIQVMDWEKGRNSGSLAAIAELVNFWGALRHANTEIRAEMVAREEEM